MRLHQCQQPPIQLVGQPEATSGWPHMCDGATPTHIKRAATDPARRPTRSYFGGLTCVTELPRSQAAAATRHAPAPMPATADPTRRQRANQLEEAAEEMLDDPCGRCDNLLQHLRCTTVSESARRHLRPRHRRLCKPSLVCMAAPSPRLLVGQLASDGSGTRLANRMRLRSTDE